MAGKGARGRRKAEREKDLGPVRYVIETYEDNDILYERLVCDHIVVARPFTKEPVGKVWRRCAECHLKPKLKVFISIAAMRSECPIN